MLNKSNDWELSPDRCFDPVPATRRLARALYQQVKELPIISPHGHVDPALLSNPEAKFGSPVDLLVRPDHYVFRMLYSQGVRLEDLGIPRRDGAPVEQDHRRIWQRFAENFYLFRGTPTGVWLKDELINVFGVTEALNGNSAQRIYDQLEARLARPEYSPRALFKRFNIDVLCTTDPATSQLEEHQRMRVGGWEGNIKPTFRPDGVVNLLAPDWKQSIKELSRVSNIEITGLRPFLQALEQRREFFKSMGAASTDHGVFAPSTELLSEAEASRIFEHDLHGNIVSEEAALFMGHMLVEMARMSIEDGLVMQLHPGSLRDHNQPLYDLFGADKGADIPVASEFTRNLRPLLNLFGNDPRLTLILFTLDESNYARELAPLAGHYPAVKLGPPWWFHDSYNGMRRYLDQVVEAAGLYNLAGFNDDTRAFPSIPARHDVWRRVTCNWLAGLVVRGLVSEEEASEMALDCAVRLVKKAYKL
jgi:glucuronate isomerase